MIAYRGEFTVKDNGKDLPARISVGTADMLSTRTWTPLLLSADPVILTWEECSLTDVIHRSQLQLNLIADNDGDYRDLAQGAEPIYGMLEINSGSGFAMWWIGAYADTTWLEPFSRKERYDVQMTFSDFGYLERLDYDGNRFGSTSQGAVTVKSIVSWLVSLFSGYVSLPDVKWMQMPEAYMNLTPLSDLLVRDVIFTEDDGTPRNMLDILTDVLEPANVHIMQYGGSVLLFTPDFGTASDIDDAVSGTLEAAGTDAELESCETYRRAELEFNPIKETESGYSPDRKGFIYQTYAGLTQYLGDNAIIIAESDASHSVERAIAYTPDSSTLMELMWMSTNYPLSWSNSAPAGVYQSASPSNMRYSLTATYIDISNDEFTPSETAHQFVVSVSLWGLFVRNDDAGLAGVTVRADIGFTSLLDGSKKWYCKSSANSVYAWRDSAPESDSLKPIFSWSSYESPVTGKGGKIGDLLSNIPAPSIPGKIIVEMDFKTLTMYDMNSDGSGSPWVSTPIILGMCGMTVKPNGYLDSSVLDLVRRKNIDISESASNVFSKSFRTGSVDAISIDSVYSFISPDGKSTVSEGQTFLDFYADFITRNYKIAADTPVRRRVRGSYMYSHLQGFPLFFAESSAPLRTLQMDDRAFFLMSEQWRLRSGISQLMLEEASIERGENTHYIYVSPSAVTLDSEGTAVSVKIESDIAWTLTVGPHLSVNPTSGRGNATISISAEKNESDSPRMSLIHIKSDSQYVGVDFIRVMQEAVVKTISVNPDNVNVPAKGGDKAVTVNSDSPWNSSVVNVTIPAGGGSVATRIKLGK